MAEDLQFAATSKNKSLKGQTWWSVFSYKPLAVICLIFQVQCGIPHVIRLHMTLDPAASSQYGWRISISVSLGPFHWRMLPGWMDQIKHLLVKFYKTVWLQWVCFVLEVKAFQSEPIQTARWFCASISPTPWWSKWINLWRSHIILRPLLKTPRTSHTYLP